MSSSNNEENKSPSLHSAINQGSIDQVRAILESGKADINHESKSHGNSPLLLSCQVGFVAAMELLLAHGADPTTRNKFRFNILHAAADSGHLKVVERIHSLLPEKWNSLVNSTDQISRTPLHCACSRKFTAVAKFLVSRGAVATHTDEEQFSILHYAAGNGDMETLEWILSFKPADIAVLLNGADVFGRTPLYWACEAGRVAAAERLIQAGTDITVRTQENCTLMHAAVSGGVEMLKSLIKIPAFATKEAIDARTSNLSTPLLLACYNGTIEVCDFLVQHGADPCVHDKNKTSILTTACRHGPADVVKWILSLPQYQDPSMLNGASKLGCTALYVATRSGHIALCDILVSAGADPFCIHSNGDTLLHAACERGSPLVVQWVLDHGFSSPDRLDIPTRVRRETALAVACKRGKFACAQLLLEAGADPMLPVPRIAGGFSPVPNALTLGLRWEELNLEEAKADSCAGRFDAFYKKISSELEALLIPVLVNIVLAHLRPPLEVPLMEWNDAGAE